MSEAPGARRNDTGWPGRWLRERVGYEPRSLALFRSALTHRSASGPNNERLEFLGDSVLNLVVARQLYEQFPAADEGDLSRLRARLVSGPPLADVAGSLALGEELLLGGGELKTGGFRRESILADALEAVIGAIFLDGGLDAASTAVLRLLATKLADLPDPATLKDAKTRLQEHLQGRGLPLPEYALVAVTGEPHEQHFAVRASVRLDARRGGELMTAQGEGSSRRRAEQGAAAELLGRLDEGAR